MKNLKIEKLAKVDIPVEHQFDDVVAVQMCIFTYNYFGREMREYLDTRIYKDGSQEVTDGDGFIPSGFRIK